MLELIDTFRAVWFLSFLQRIFKLWWRSKYQSYSR